MAGNNPKLELTWIGKDKCPRLYDNAGDKPQLLYGTSASEAKSGMAGAQAAMHRAAQRARLIAQQTGTDLIIARAGHVVRVSSEKIEIK